MRAVNTLLILYLAICVGGCHSSLDIYYMDTACGSTIDLTDVESASVETSKALTYPNGLNCDVTFTAPNNKRFFFQITRFITEWSNGDCFDHLSIYDGDSASAQSIASKLCGELTGKPVFNTTSSAITFSFVSDESAKDRGFAILLLAFNPGPSCGDDEILCPTRGICIDKQTSLCDDFDHCGDGVDESDCTGGSQSEGGVADMLIGLIVGVAVGGVAFLIILILIIRFAYKKYKWKQYMKTLYNSKKLVVKKKLQTSYPLTHNYQDEELINVARAQRDAAMVDLDEVTKDQNFGPNGAATPSDLPGGNQTPSGSDFQTEPLPEDGGNSELSENIPANDENDSKPVM